MTTFQAIVYSIVHGFTEFLPVSSAAHNWAVSYLFGWPAPPVALIAALKLGSLLAVFFYFLHDWASMFSCFLQVIIYRKRPMTMDERMPMFLIVGSFPLAVGWYFLQPQLGLHELTAPIVAALLCAFALPLWFFPGWSRKNKNVFDWNWFDSLYVGVAQIAALIPGCGQTSAVVIGSMSRNYSREAAVKFAYYLAFPLLAGSSAYWLRDFNRGDLSWLSFGMALVVSFLCGLLAMGGLMRHIQRKAFGQFVAYRFIAAGVLIGAYWLKSQG